jgi:hypothetical protein
MKLTPLLLVILISCCRVPANELSGLWKVERIEVLHNNVLKAKIDTGCQYWAFNARKRIDIFEQSSLRNQLDIKIGSNCIMCVDRMTGEVIDEYRISKLNKKRLLLCNYKKLNEDEYSIMYYFDKVDRKDTIELRP